MLTKNQGIGFVSGKLFKLLRLCELISKFSRNAEKEQVAEDAEIVPGTEWERISKLCDFNPKASKASKDVSRMRSIILQLKQNPLPPKA